MIIIGINLTHDGTLTVLKDGQNIFSIAEERLNRVKAYIGFPFKSLKYIVDEKIIDPSNVQKVCVSSSVFLKEWAYTYAFQLNENKKYYDIQNDLKPDDFYMADSNYRLIKNDSGCKNYVHNKINDLLSEVGIFSPIEFIDHHLSHSSSAYYSSGFDSALSISMDGEGDLLSATVNKCIKGNIKKISETKDENSAGNLYSEVTKLCGFKISRHEGKITGLAAYGSYLKHENCFEKLLKVVDGKLEYVNPVKNSLQNRIIRKILSFIGYKKFLGAAEMVRRCGNLSNEDLSASIQKLLEERLAEIISFWINKTGIYNIVLSGGVFANVKFNQIISEIPKLEKLFIYPNMGDGGNAYGAAAYSYFKNHPYYPKKTTNVYLGPEFSNKQVKSALNNYMEKIDFHISDNITQETAELIANKKIVGWFQGRMEYGPRALGHRSILASAEDKSINDWLNRRLNRTEFMPFAPSCLYEYADEVFEIPKSSLKYPAKFMTITFKIKDRWAHKVPAVTHVDQTARPQLIKIEENPKYYDLLKRYNDITGLPLFINTSFNTHEEPIVCTPNEGIKPLLNGVIDYLCIGDYVCKLKNRDN